MTGAATTPPGRLIVLEGIDGSGKSTLATRLTTRLEAAGTPCARRREPTDGPAGRKLRRIITEGRKGIAPEEETALFIEDRRQHVAQGITPDLAAGTTVVLDRYYLSTAAYQGALGMDPAAIMAENETFAPQPDLAFILDLPVDEALARINVRGEQRTSFEKRAYLEDVRDVFLGLRRPWIRLVDATADADELLSTVIGIVGRELPGLAVKA